MKFEDDDWRFESPGETPSRLVSAVSSIVGRIATQGDARDVYEHFTHYFARAAGTAATASSSTSWAETDMFRLMEDAATNAPLFIEGFVDGCDALAIRGLAVPKMPRINRLLEESQSVYRIVDGSIVKASQTPAAKQADPLEALVVEAVGISAGVATATGTPANGGLKIFLCHSSGDKAAVRVLYKRLRDDGYDPWLDEEDLLPGQDWKSDITKAMRASDVVLVCLSRTSIVKKGFVQEEIRFAVDTAKQMPPGAIFMIQTRLEECELPDELNHLHRVDLFAANGYQKLGNALATRAQRA